MKTSLFVTAAILALAAVSGSASAQSRGNAAYIDQAGTFNSNEQTQERGSGNTTTGASAACEAT